jgi:hypothetical protein
MIYCGIDWGEKTHAVALVDDEGTLLAKRQITDDAAGYQILIDLLAEHGDSEAAPIPVATETSRGLLVAVLRTGKRQIYAVNPMAPARYRDRHAVTAQEVGPRRRARVGEHPFAPTGTPTACRRPTATWPAP